MIMRSIIFDMDLTLVDTTCLEELRHKREWSQVYNLIPQTSMYAGMADVLEVIRKHNIKTAIVSTSPRPYIERLIAFYNIPAPMLKALEFMQIPASKAISFGDRVIDIQASNAAGIESVACFWGTKEKSELLQSGYSHAIVRPDEILTLIR